MVKDFNQQLGQYFKYFRSKSENNVTLYDKYVGISGVLRTHVVDNWLYTQKISQQENAKRVYFLSLEYNLGSPLKMHTLSNGLGDELDSMLKRVGSSRNEIVTSEPPMDLGNGFIGEFSGNILESLASNDVPSVAYGLWYGMGQFKQSTHVLGQTEMPYYWSSLHNPWVVDRPEYNNSVFFGGRLVQNSEKFSWIPDSAVTATPLDYPISGYGNKVVNTLRFWDALPSSDFLSDYSLHNDYIRACDDKFDSVKFLRCLFNEEVSRQTSELHIRQQYFLASASIKDILRRHVNTQNNSVRTICDKAQIVIADCRMGLAIVEFIRILIYDYGVSVEEAVTITKKTFVVSLPLVEGGEFPKVPLYILKSLLPQHAKVIMDINHVILSKAREIHNVSDAEAREISLIEEGAMQKICMANLSLMFSGSVFGYSQDGADYIKNVAFPNTIRIYNIDVKPSFSGVSLRRWLIYSNRNLTRLITAKIGDKWIKNNAKLSEFEKYAQDRSVQKEFCSIKAAAKEKYVKKIGGLLADNYLPDTVFITHLRKMTLVNSQILMLFYIACRYIRLNKGEKLIPRTYFFAGRAMPSDFYGKQLVSLISIFSLALQNCRELQVYFVHNCTSSVEEELLAVGDITEFISSPTSLESSSFSAFRAAANGLIPLAGINHVDINIISAIGKDSCFFLKNRKDNGDYNVGEYIANTPILQEALNLVSTWIKDYSGGEEEEVKLYPLLASLQSRDEMKTFSFFDEYCEAQDRIDLAYQNKSEWASMALRNIARSGAGSLDNVVSSLYYGKDATVI